MKGGETELKEGSQHISPMFTPPPIPPLPSILGVKYSIKETESGIFPTARRQQTNLSSSYRINSPSSFIVLIRPQKGKSTYRETRTFHQFGPYCEGRLGICGVCMNLARVVVGSQKKGISGSTEFCVYDLSSVCFLGRMSNNNIRIISLLLMKPTVAALSVSSLIQLKCWPVCSHILITLHCTCCQILHHLYCSACYADVPVNYTAFSFSSGVLSCTLHDKNQVGKPNVIETLTVSGHW